MSPSTPALISWKFADPSVSHPYEKLMGHPLSTPFSGKMGVIRLLESVGQKYQESRDDNVSVPLHSCLQALRQNSQLSIRETFLTLPILQRKILIERLGEDFLQRLFSLSQQDQPKLFEEMLLALGREALKKEEYPFAGAVFQTLSNSTSSLGFKVSTPIQKEALAQWNAVIGVGNGWRRLEYSTQKFTSGFANLGLYGGMFAGTALFSLGKNLIASRLAARAAAWWTHGAVASIISSSAALPGEILAFYGVNKGYHLVASPYAPDSTATLPQELGAVGLTLGLLKLGNAGSSALFSLVHGTSLKTGAVPLFTRWSQKLFPQAGMFAAISLGNYFEAKLGWKPTLSSDNFWTDALVTLGHFNLTGAIFHHLAGRGFAEWTQQVAQQTQGYFSLGDIFSLKEFPKGLRQVPQAAAVGLGEKGEGYHIFNTKHEGRKEILPTRAREYIKRRNKQTMKPEDAPYTEDFGQRHAAIMNQLKEELNIYEETIIGLNMLLRRKMGELQLVREQGKSFHRIEGEIEHLNELNTRLRLKQRYLERKFNVGGNVKGEEVLDSLQRALEISREYFAKLEIPALPAIDPQSRALTENALEVVSTDFLSAWKFKALDATLAETVLGMIRRSNSEEAFQYEVLNGLTVFINESGRDQIQGTVSFLRRIIGMNPPDVDALQIFLTRIMFPFSGKFQTLAKDDVIHIMGTTEDFHRVYPFAFGPFIDLFVTANLTESRQALLAEPVLRFARHHLDEGRRVTFSRESIGYATMVVEESSGVRSHYEVGAILGEVSKEKDFKKVGERLYAKLFIGDPENPQLELDISQPKFKIYLDIGTLGKKIGPETLWLWGKRLFEEGRERVVAQLIADTVKKAIQKEKSPFRSIEMVGKLREKVQDYWTQRARDIEQIEIGYRLKGEKQIRHLVIDKNTISHKQLIVALQEEIKNPNIPLKIRAQKVLQLVRMLKEDNRLEDFLANLRQGAREFPQNKALRNYFQEWVRAELERHLPNQRLKISPSHEFSLKLFSTLFGKNLSAENVNNLLNLTHPDYKFGKMEVYREGRQLRIDFTVWDQATSKPVGEIWTALEVPDNSSHWQLKIIRVEIEADHQKKSISTFAVNRIIKLANALEVPRLVLDSDGMGRYAWLRMGFKFDSKESEVSLANLLSLFIQNKKIKIEVPNKQDPSRWTLEESMHLLTQFNLKTREKFVEFWAFQPLLVMSLTNGSPELANFKSYFARKDYKIRGFRIGD